MPLNTYLKNAKCENTPQLSIFKITGALPTTHLDFTILEDSESGFLLSYRGEFALRLE